MFEYPLPVLAVDAERILIETKGRSEGYLTVKNSGGQTLSGRIVSRARSLAFTPSEFAGNETRIKYVFDPGPSDGWKPGDVLETFAIISSNGGERKIPVTIRLTQMALATQEGPCIVNLSEFYEYAQTSAANAKKLFVESDFYMFLLSAGYPFMEAYEILHTDFNRERALDSFFILSGFKPKTEMHIPIKRLRFAIKHGETEPIQGSFIVQKTDSGYYETPLTKLTRAPWLKLSVERLISSDFNEANATIVKFAIDPARVPGAYERERVALGQEPNKDDSNVVEIIARRQKPLAFKLDREAYRFEDKGTVEVINNTGEDLIVEPFCQEPYVKFAAKQYIVEERSGIPFEIRLGAFMAAQVVFRKIPYLKTTIELKAYWKKSAVKRNVPLTVGKW
ncbi:MAG: DUF5717 family protein [Defluviitaleaceae bacterium]|nr:DUF5717 family protein [Defluviitaleaceae bacterium]